MISITNIKRGLRDVQVSRLVRGAVAAGLVVATVLALTACSTEAVCQGKPENVAVVPSTSESDLATDRALASQVAQQALSRAVSSCGRMIVGIQDNKPQADLALQAISLTSPYARAYNRAPEQRKLKTAGQQFVQQQLLTPLAKIHATFGSPFMGALVKIGTELQVHQWAPATIILLGDGLDIEPVPNGDGTINLAVPVASPSAATELKHQMFEFVPLLRPLKGSCVMLVAAGAANRLPDARIRTAQQLMAETLKAAGVGFVATRSSQLPPIC